MIDEIYDGLRNADNFLSTAYAPNEGLMNKLDLYTAERGVVRKKKTDEVVSMNFCKKEFNRLKAEIAAKKIDVVVTMRAATIARNWGQFMEFMLICSKKNVEVVCIDKVEDAQAVFRRIQEFQKRFFEGSDVTCE